MTLPVLEATWVSVLHTSREEESVRIPGSLLYSSGGASGGVHTYIYYIEEHSHLTLRIILYMCIISSRFLASGGVLYILILFTSTSLWSRGGV
jgi:hypothetical protein